MIDGTTKISTLLKMKARIEAVLAEKDQKEVKKVQAALETMEQLRTQLQEAEALIG